ncbi:MAG: rhomboid family intramembrane serine protease [Clostridia bacterium]|nr:rhomboid family intramembrane serine protease [Clostridia bacterium]
MTSVIRNILAAQLITRKGYMPITDENGQIPVFDNMTILQKSNAGAYTLLELIDGDELTKDQINSKMENSLSFLQSIDGNFSSINVEVFIFKNGIPLDKLEVIKALQRRNLLGKKYLVTFTIDLKNSKVNKHFKGPLFIDGLYKFFDNTIKDGQIMHSEPIEMDELLNRIELQRKENEIPVQDHKPIAAYTFLAINILIWLYAKFVDESIIDLGLKVNPLIMEGEYWRLITPAFLHVDPIHLLMNSYSLFSVGPFVERILGTKKFLAIYLFAGLTGSIASFVFSQTPSLGASGAIFGLMGALIYIGQKYGRAFGSSFITGIAITILLNLSYGFTHPRIDNFGHIGGLIGGYLAAVCVGVAGGTQSLGKRVIVVAVTLALTFGGLFGGFINPANVQLKKSYQIDLQAESYLKQAEESFKNKQYQQSEELARKALSIGSNNANIKINSTFYVAASLINQNKPEQAMEHGKTLVDLDPQTGHFILGFSHYMLGNREQAKEELTKAYKLNPKNEQTKELLKELEK